MSSVITVSQLNRYLASKLRSDLKLKGIAVKGEISILIYITNQVMLILQ